MQLHCIVLLFAASSYHHSVLAHEGGVLQKLLFMLPNLNSGWVIIFASV